MRRGVAIGCGAVLTLVLSGCGGGGGSSGGSSPEPSSPAATTTIDLAPGQTSAVLGWAPSRGPVEDYLVLQARNGGAWTFLARVNPPRVEVRGQPGDEIQIMTIAEGSNGSSSDPSPPSPILRFHAPAPPPGSDQTAAVAVVASGSSPAAEPLSDPDPQADSEAGSDAERTESMTDGPASADPSDPDHPGPEADGTKLGLALRDRLLRADLRFAVHRLSARAAHWLAEQVAEEPTAGLTLLASGRYDADAWSELVWRDAAGQLFLSDGSAVATRTDLIETQEATIRLRATERFVGLADVDGDAIGDWLIEETTTGEVWISDGATTETRPALVGADLATELATELAAELAAARLAGHGDFDGDGRVELVWRREDDSLFLGGGGDDEARALAGEELPSMSIEALLAIADFDGDGLDDLASRDSEGRLELLLARRAGSGVRFEKRSADSGPRIEGLDLIATLDLDGDGASELVWLGEDALEIWDARSGPRTKLAWTAEHGFEERALPAETD